MGWGRDREGIVDFGAEGAGQPGHGARARGLVILCSLSSCFALPCLRNEAAHCNLGLLELERASPLLPVPFPPPSLSRWLSFCSSTTAHRVL